MKFLFGLAGFATVVLFVFLLVWSVRQGKAGNWQSFFAVTGCAALLIIIWLAFPIFSNPKIYRPIFSIFGRRWGTEIVKEGDRLDLGGGKFRLMVGKTMNYRTLFPGDVICLKVDKPYIQVLEDQWGRRVVQHHPAGARTLLGETTVVGVGLEGKFPGTTLERQDGWCR